MSSKPTFAKSNEEGRHFIDLKEAVESRLANSKENLSLPKIKFFVLPLLYLSCWMAAMYFKTLPGLYYTFYCLMGITMVLIFVNLIHEACHLLLFEKKRHNQMAMYLFDLIGANSYIWGLRHIRLHHNYPNTIGWDSDIEQSGPIKIFPTENPSFLQRNQHYYIFFLYPLFLLNWLLLRDFKDFYTPKRYIQKVVNIPRIEFFKLWFFKIFFISYIVLIPIFIFNIDVAQALTGFVLLMICGSLLGMIILLPPHANVHNEFPVPDEKEHLSTTWLTHQFTTTNDVDGNNFITKHVLNNFNFHIAHHLFPNVSAAHTQEVTEIIREFAEEHHLPYKSYSLWEALRLHYLLVKRNSIDPKSIFEETM